MDRVWLWVTTQEASRRGMPPEWLRKIIFGNRSDRGAPAQAVNLTVLHTARCANLDPIRLLQTLLLEGDAPVTAELFADSS